MYLLVKHYIHKRKLFFAEDCTQLSSTFLQAKYRHKFFLI